MDILTEINIINDIRSIKSNVEEIHAMLNILVQKKVARTKQSEPSKTKEERVNEFKQRCLMEFSGSISIGTIGDFIGYWTESSENSKKLRFEKEKVFDIRRRMATWLKNNKKVMPSTIGANGFNVAN